MYIIYIHVYIYIYTHISLSLSLYMYIYIYIYTHIGLLVVNVGQNTRHAKHKRQQLISNKQTCGRCRTPPLPRNVNVHTT